MSAMYGGEKLHLRCPKCRGRTYELREHYVAATIYSVVDGVLPKCADDHFVERTTAVTATCKCGHSWRAKGAIGLGDVVQESVTATTSKPNAAPTTTGEAG